MDLQHMIATEDRDAVERWCESRARSEYLGGNVALTRVLGRYPMLVDTADLSVAPRLMLDGFWEMWTTIAMAKYLKPGMRCIDVGASFGYFTVAMAQWVGPTGHVLSVEPNAACTSLLKRTTRYLNGLSNVSVVEAVVGASPGRCDLLTNWDAAHDWSSHRYVEIPDGAENVAPKLRVTLDARAEGAWSFAKIDAEGAEPEVWQGMQELIARSPQLNVAMEFEASRYEDAARFLRSFGDAGFSVRVIGERGELKPTSTTEVLDGKCRMLWLARR